MSIEVYICTRYMVNQGFSALNSELISYVFRGLARDRWRVESILGMRHTVYTDGRYARDTLLFAIYPGSNRKVGFAVIMVCPSEVSGTRAIREVRVATTWYLFLPN